MRRVAHLSDVHILDPRVAARQARYRLATKLVSLGRAIDPSYRAGRLATALAAAKARGAEHFVISGDLTELGEEVEFERFAEVLHDAALPADSVTLVPGNHDAYTAPDGWKRALAGPLAAFARASAAEPGKVVDRGELVFLPIDTSCFRTIAASAYSGGLFTRRTAEDLEARVADPGLRDKALVLVAHHPPFHPAALPIVRWLDGLRGARDVLELLSRHPRLQLLHGHLHRSLDRILTGSPRGWRTTPHDGTTATPARMFGAAATCDGGDTVEDAVVRLYDVRAGALHPVVAVAPVAA